MKLYQVPADKAQHFCYGAAVGLVAGLLTAFFIGVEYAHLASTLAALTVGVGKELLDMNANRLARKQLMLRPHYPSWGDVLATTLGGYALGVF